MAELADRRYYFANTVAAVILQLGVPERVRPRRKEYFADPEHIAWMAIKVARMDVHTRQESVEASAWVRRIRQAMEHAGYWSVQRSAMLYELDRAQHFHLPVA